MSEYFTPPRVQPYDPIPNDYFHDISINVEWQRQDRDNWTLGMVEAERTGRVRVVIEGEGDLVQPYLDAIQHVSSTGTSPDEA